MTVNELYGIGLRMLKESGNADYSFDCDCLFTAFTGVDKTRRIINRNDDISAKAENSFFSAVKRRIDGEPLQYILGEWEFMGLPFKVGEGVLIPRPETEMLVETANEFLKNKVNAVVFDLCAGSGAIGLSVARYNPNVTVYLFEKYDGALKYLRENAGLLELPNVKILKYDIFNGFPNDLPKADILLSNPPYIKDDEVPLLQKEVSFEPDTALKGGEDGLVFYKAIHDKWLDGVKKGGIIVFECGDGQSEDIKSMFSDKSDKISVLYDFNDIDRTVKINV